jgi:hypothetical protein
MTVLIPINTTPAPSRVDTPNFAARADAYHAWLPTAVDAMNAQNTENNALATDVTTKSAAAVVAAAVVTSANPIANAAAAAASAATAASAMAAASASSLAATTARDAAIAAWAASTAPTEQLSAISKSLHVGTVVKSIIYDTSKDSDGGAWRKRMQDKSWYNETLGGSTWLGQQPSEAVARGSFGSTASPNLVTNGTFATTTTGWTLGNSATLSAVSGKLRLTNTAALNGIAYQAITTEVGRTYLAYAEQTAGTNSSWFFYAGTTAGGNQLGTNSGPLSSVTSSTFTFVATSTTSYISVLLNATNGHYADFDNISVKLADSAIDTSNLLYQSTADGKFYKTVSTSGVTEVRRGISREFPALAAIVAESLRIVIYDLTQASCPMWMVFVSGDVVLNGLLSFDQSTGSPNNYIASIAALNGVLYVAQNTSGNGQGLRVINFITEFTDRISDSTRLNTWRFKGNISRRNNADSGYQYSSAGLVNLSANDVAITVLDTAPTDPATGLPVPTVAVATTGGLSIIKDDGTVVNITYTTDTRVNVVSLDGPNKQVFFGGDNVGNNRNFLWHVFDIPSSSINDSASYVKGSAKEFYSAYYNPSYSNLDLTLANQGNMVSTITLGKGVIVPNDRRLVLSNDYGVFFAKRNPSTPAKGLTAAITNTYNSGWQVGDSRGAYLADTTAETVTASGELVTNGTFATDTSGWTPKANTTLSVVSGSMRIVGTVTDASCGQTISTVVGRTYKFVFTITATGNAGTDRGGVQVVAGTQTNVSNWSLPNLAAGTYYLDYVATSTTTSVVLGVWGTAGCSVDFDNISVKLAEPDRSVKNNGLIVNGTLTKTAVASGAGLVAYSGFSASNYLEQPYNSNLDFGTGDFCVMGWVTPSSLASLGYLFGRQNSGATGSRFYSYVSATTGLINFNVTDGTTSVPISGGTAVLSTPTFVVCYKQGAVMYLSVNATQVATATAPALTFNNATAVFRLGVDHTASNPFLGSLALWRISATAPSADQIAHIYRTELPLFQAGAQCTIAGTSTTVTALAYDKVADELHVGTSWGRSEFHDLLRVASEATTAGAITSLSANEGTILTGGTSARVYAPALVLRDELAKPSQGSAQPQPYQQFSVKDQQVFLSQAGVKIVGVYIRGMLKKPGVDYTVTYDGFRYTVTTTDKLASRTEVTLLQIKE